jgi:23S rRNA pseudouridine955/2504/2580 synthase
LNTEANKKNGVRHVEVSPDHAGQRVDNFLARQLKGVPKAGVYRMIRTGQVRINGKRCKPEHKLVAGDAVRLPPARTQEDGSARVSASVLEQVRQAVVYEDAHYLVINKPSGMAVHSGSGLPWGLIDAVRQAWPGQYAELAHRIDRETSGCVLLARSGDALRHLAAQFREGTIVKQYLCLLDGVMQEARAVVNAPLLKVRSDQEHSMDVDAEGKDALTHFRLLQAYAGASYVEAEIFTGRTHQIRVHAAHLGLPLAGDNRYSSADSQKKWKERGLNRLFLHAHHLVFTSLPGEKIECHAPLPAALCAVLDAIEP